MGLFSSITDPLGLRKKTRKAVGIKEDPLDPFGHIKKLEKGVGEELGLDFEKFHFKQIWDDLRRNPGRILYGSFDPLSTKMWNEVLGTDYDPIINQMGGATNQRFADYVAAGGDPKLAEKAARNHQIAATVASIYAGGALGALGGAGGAAAGTAGGATAGGITGGLTAAMPAGATFAAGLSGTGALATAAVTAGAAEADEEFPMEMPEQLITRPGSFRVPNVPGFDEGGLARANKGGSKKNWIKGAIKKPGALRRSLKVKSGDKIPAKLLASAAKKPGKMGQRARLAQTMRKF